MIRARNSAWGDIALPILAAATAMASFQVGAAAAKSLFPFLGAEGTATLRLGIGALVLLAIARPWRNWPRSAPVWSLIGVGFAMSGAVGFFYLSIRTLPLGIAIPLQFLGPLTVAIFSSRRLSDLFWVVLAAAGIWLLTSGGMGELHFDLAGILYALCAAASWAAYILLGPRVSAAFGGSAAPLAVTVATLVVLPFGTATAGSNLLDLQLMPLAVLVAVLSTVLPFSLEFYALPRLPSRTFAILTSLEPMFAVLAGFVFLDEQLAAPQLLGVLCVMVAAAGAAWSSAGQGQGTPVIE